MSIREEYAEEEAAAAKAETIEAAPLTEERVEAIVRRVFRELREG
ncbi:hypothetical protein [Amycolatopsis sp. NPDC059657]